MTLFTWLMVAWLMAATVYNGTHWMGASIVSDGDGRMSPEPSAEYTTELRYDSMAVDLGVILEGFRCCSTDTIWPMLFDWNR